MHLRAWNPILSPITSSANEIKIQAHTVLYSIRNRPHTTSSYQAELAYARRDSSVKNDPDESSCKLRLFLQPWSLLSSLSYAAAG